MFGVLFLLAFAFAVSGIDGGSSSRLSVSHGHFKLNGQQVFLSGGNLPWIHYGNDFGDGRWWGVKDQVENQMKMMHNAGGNSLRLWIHIQAETTPIFDQNGYVLKMDNQGSFVNEFKDMLDTAQSHDILVFPTLWNGAVNQDYSHRMDGLIVDQRKLQTYLDKVLTPLVQAVKGHPALGAWDIMNEPEGMIKPDVHNADKCFDTTKLHNSGAGWAGKKYTYQDMLRFINWQSDAIKREDPQALVTMGVWNPKSNTDNFNFVDHYTDACLTKAGGKSLGILDFYQFHSYSWHNNWDEVAPFTHSAGQYGTSKPIVIGEFWTKDSGGMSDNQLFDYAYNHGYSGAWSWDLVGHGGSQRGGMTYIRHKTNHGHIAIDI